MRACRIDHEAIIGSPFAGAERDRGDMSFADAAQRQHELDAARGRCGFVVDPRTEDLLREVPALLRETVESSTVDERTDPGLIKEKVRVDLQRFIRKRVGRRPLVLPVIMEI